MEDVHSGDILSDIIVHMKYARYLPEKKRRETWEEIVDRNKQMHIDKFPDLETEIEEAYKFVYEKKVLPSMRTLQFAGRPMVINNLRGYNCSWVVVDHPAAFSETMFALLSGTGVGYSVQSRHVNKLPNLLGPERPKDHRQRKRRFLVADSIEGWGEAIKVLMESYFYGKKEIEFDFRDIRPKGAKLITSGGKAPGPQPLKDALHNIQKVLDSALDERGVHTKLKPIEVHDIQTYIADAVLAGGIRRSACISLFDLDDDEMLSAKAGAWWELNPQRARANNSVVIDRRRISKEEFFEVWKRIEASGSGEPGIFFTNENGDMGGNPCLTGDTPLLTADGYKPIKSLADGNVYTFINYLGEEVDGIAWYTGDKPTLTIKAGNTKDPIVIQATPDHRFMTIEGKEVEAKDLLHERLMPKHVQRQLNYQSLTLRYGFLFGDGVFRTKTDEHKNISCCFTPGLDDEVAQLFEKTGWSKSDSVYTVDVSHEELQAYGFDFTQDTHEKTLPKGIDQDFLAGLYSANGSVINGHGRVTFKTTSKMLASEVVNVLKSMGFENPYITTNKPTLIEWDNGEYISRESYDVNLVRLSDLVRFYEEIGFIQSYKNEKLKAEILRKSPYVFSVKESGVESVYDFSLRDDTHWGVANGIVTHNCLEVSLHNGQLCVAGDTKLITRDGITDIESSVGKNIEIWNGEEWSEVTPYQTGEADPLYRVSFSDGTYLDATANHKFLIKHRFQKEFREVETVDLISELKSSKYGLQVPRTNIVMDSGKSVPSAYDFGFILGDGCVYDDRVIADLYNEKRNLPFSTEMVRHSPQSNRLRTINERVVFDVDVDYVKNLKYEAGLPEDLFTWNRESILNFIAGWADADGSQAGRGIRIYGKKDKLQDAQLLLTKAGINSSLNLMQEKGNKTNYGTRNYAIWYLQITVTIDIPCKRLVCNNERSGNKGMFQIVKSVEPLDGLHKSFCLTEDKLHQCVFNNVLTKQCNLVEINSGTLESQEDFNERAKAASFISTLQASYTDFHYLRPLWREITEKESLIGVSLTGIASGRVLDLDMKEAAKVVKTENKRAAKLLGINTAARQTVVKPSGTASLVLNTSSGIHAWHDEYYIRRVRVGKNEAIYKYLSVMHPELVEDEIFRPKEQAVISVPIKAPDGAITRTESEIDLLERVKKVHQDWIKPGHVKGANTNNVSVTVSIRPEKWEEVGQWMWENRDSYTGISVLPYDNGTYQQAPFESITKEQYEEMVKTLHKVDLKYVIEDDDETDLIGEAACAGGSCEIV